jgi:hypothetical protein
MNEKSRVARINHNTKFIEGNYYTPNNKGILEPISPDNVIVDSKPVHEHLVLLDFAEGIIVRSITSIKVVFNQLGLKPKGNSLEDLIDELKSHFNNLKSLEEERINNLKKELR